MSKYSEETLDFGNNIYNVFEVMREFKNDKRYEEKMSVRNGDKKIFDLRTILSFTSTNMFSEYQDVLDLYSYVVKDIPKDELEKAERPLFVAMDYVMDLFPEIRKMSEQVSELYEVDFEYEYLIEAERRYGKYYPIVSMDKEYFDNYLGKSKVKRP